MRVQYNIIIDSDLRDEWNAKFKGVASSEIEKLMRVRLESKNISDAAEFVHIQKLAQEEREAIEELKSLNQFDYFELNNKAYGVTAVDYLKYFLETGNNLYKK